MSADRDTPLSNFYFLDRVSASVPELGALEDEIQESLTTLNLPVEKLRGRRIGIAVGSRGIASLPEIVRAICAWLKEQGAEPFIFPAMGSHGGATAEGQRGILAGYGVTAENVGAEVISSMETVCIGTTPEGIRAFMDRRAWESDGVIVMNRIKPHTDFSGKIESGLLKMMAVGMGKIDGASETHRAGWKFGFERAIRAVSAVTVASGKVLAGVGVVENELHQICAARAVRPEGMAAMDEQVLAMARRLVPRIPFPKLQLLIVDEIGKDISGVGMDAKVIGRVVELRPGEAPEIEMIYIRDLTPESDGNAVGMGFADLMHERLYRKVDFKKTYINARTALNPGPARQPLFLPSDRQAVDIALGHLGSPDPAEQRIVWIRNTLDLARIAVSERLARDASSLTGWRVSPEAHSPQFDVAGDLNSLF